MNIYTPTVAYLYKWTELTTRRWYIGSRTKQGCHPNDGYICSSRTVKPLILEQRSNWHRELLCLGTPEYILALETRLLTAIDAKNDPLSYNQHNGDGKFTTTGMDPWNKGKTVPTNKPAWNRGLTKENSPSVAKMATTKQGKAPGNKGVPMSDEQKLKLSLIATGRPSPKKGKPGKPQTAEANEKRSEKLKGRKQSPEHIAKRAQARKDYYENNRGIKPLLSCCLDER